MLFHLFLNLVKHLINFFFFIHLFIMSLWLCVIGSSSGEINRNWTTVSATVQLHIWFYIVFSHALGKKRHVL